MEMLKQHLTEAHNFEFEHIERTFPAARLFEEWKSTVENERFLNLVADHSEEVNKKGERVRTLVCNRSGTYKGKGASQRSYPLKGRTSKIGRPCTCTIKGHYDIMSTPSTKLEMCIYSIMSTPPEQEQMPSTLSCRHPAGIIAGPRN